MQTLNHTKTTETRSSQSEPFLIIDNVSKVYQTQKGPYTVLDGVNLTVQEGEFICIIGHSGCGKSTLLNMVAGFNQPTSGQVRLQGTPITEPGPDRMVVFQNYSLLPWMSASENIHLGVERVYADKPREAQHQIVKEHLELVGLTEAAHKRPGQLSGGMKQRVAIARALATRPQLLILDEPFGALDPITREELQEELLKIWREHKVTVLMITHDIDEALFLADRVVMMTNGPSAYIGEDLKVPFARPRNRARIMEDPQYYELRNFALDFLFRRYAHTETEEEDTSQTSSNPLPTASQTESNGHSEQSALLNKVPISNAISTATSPTTIPLSASTATKESSMSSEPGSSTKSIALAVWLAAMIGLTAVNIISVSRQKEVTQTASASAPSSVVSSPSAPPPPPPIAAVPQTTAVSASPSPASETPTAALTPVESSPTSPTSPDAATTASPSPASASPVASDASSVATANSSVEPTPSNDLGKKLYDQVDQNWKTTPSFSENLVYRVKVTQNGSILQYEPSNNAAKDFAQETPLAALKANSATGTPSPESQTTTDFRLTFTPKGTVEVQPW